MLYELQNVLQQLLLIRRELDRRCRCRCRRGRDLRCRLWLRSNFWLRSRGRLRCRRHLRLRRNTRRCLRRRSDCSRWSRRDFWLSLRLYLRLRFRLRFRLSLRLRLRRGLSFRLRSSLGCRRRCHHRTRLRINGDIHDSAGLNVRRGDLSHLHSTRGVDDKNGVVLRIDRHNHRWTHTGLCGRRRRCRRRNCSTRAVV